ncbi:hypothetical protein SCLCIDRAFT_1177308 [Scleroderma citrinum Foug A]|uniref:Uncharacterized protein n=1 Tax=Scleroderma citrinum Foug A TaxID=1036808 RepID=A0A0C3AWG3_9AGAM|nr:hypothetical protein SCLCIDRAFT_1177308 [Scleroderma citrinum Foug A]
MEVMVTFNVSTDLNMANGAQGHLVDIVLDPRETADINNGQGIELQYPPVYVLVQMCHTKATVLETLPVGVLLIIPLCKTFNIMSANGKKRTVSHVQLPITPAYAFTDYCAQGQTLDCCIVDIGPPPTGQLTPFNAYVALSRSHGHHNIHLLRNFEERLFTQHPSEYLRKEDRCLEDMDQRMTVWWDKARISGKTYRHTAQLAQ